ncbi:ATP synthase subunit b, mitochondrial-like [Rhopalosiphum maidis]|uniref:ATP synthase subunit b, mitochondrial-like n=1 Tax=Rhopalosiphum maidis TaxID=43146 RepID=UPI000EFEE0D6|nr:ATP synthase subunit b, mitochondrial-like [Rhopalosiphum maidis]
MVSCIKLVSGVIQTIIGARKIAMSKFDTKLLPYETLEKRIKIIDGRLGHPLSLTEKMLHSHSDDPVNQDIERGVSYLKLRSDRVAMQDATVQMATPDLTHPISKRTTQTKPAVATTNESIIVPGFPKPNGQTQSNPYDGPERDLVNFPRMVRLEEPAKTRYLFVPEECFEVFYKKTGVTGPYVLAAGVTTYLLSKEIWVVEHEFPYVLATVGLFYIGWKKFGTPLANFLDKEIDEYEASCNARRQGEIDGLKENIENQKTETWRTEAQQHVIQAKRENVAIQLEAIYRERALQVYNQVKRRLDYQLDLAILTRSVQQRHMVNWIIENVLKSLTNEQEKQSFKKCMVDLQALAAKA